MPAGLQMWDESGRLILDTSTSVGRFLGVVAIANASVSVYSEGFLTGRPFYVFLPSGDPSTGNDRTWNTPTMSVSGPNVSFIVSGQPGGDFGKIFYGVY
jgi:hypothetical protein